MRRARADKTIADDENPYWISFSDLMSGLLILFILATLYFIAEYNKSKDENKKRTEEIIQEIEWLKAGERIRREVIDEIETYLSREGIIVHAEQNALIIPDNTITFDSESIRLRDEDISRTQRIGQILEFFIGLIDQSTVKRRQYYFDTIFIEGHADCGEIDYCRIVNSSMDKGLCEPPLEQMWEKEPEVAKQRRSLGNWPLSTLRAIAIWEAWTQTDYISLHELKNLDGAPLFSVSGYAATRPRAGKQAAVCQEQDESAKKRDRRIEIRFTLRAVMAQKMQDVLNRRPTVE